MTSPNFAPSPCVLFVNIQPQFTDSAFPDLAELGYVGFNADTENQVFHLLREQNPHLMILDYSTAPESVHHLCQTIRQMGNRIPILILVEDESLDNRIACLEMGADDYLLSTYQKDKFFQFVQLYLTSNQGEAEQLQFGSLCLDLQTRQFIRQGKAIDLTMKEFELLKYLMSHPHEVLTREQILENVWGFDFQGESNVIEVYIRYLRLKLEEGGNKRLIQTVRGVGYVLRET